MSGTTEQTLPTGSTSASLIARIRQHDPLAWQAVARSYGPLVYSWARQSGLQSSDAADVMQETFRSVAARIETFRRQATGDSFRGWLWTITRNKIRDHFRTLSQRPDHPVHASAQHLLAQIPDELPGDASSIAQAGNALSLLVREALTLVQNEFEAPTWQAFWRVAIDGQKPADVADELGLSLGAVYMAKSRVLRRLREELAGLF